MMEAACWVPYEQQALSGERNAGLVVDNEPIETVQNYTYLETLI